MLTEDRTIIKINGKNTVLNIMESFNIGKVKLQFRSYDLSKPKGERVTNSIDIFMDISEFSYFCEILRTQDIYRIGKQRRSQPGQYPEPAYSLMGGSADGTVSRQFRVEIGEKKPIIFSAFSGPGKKNSTGLIVPQYKFNTAQSKVSMHFDMEQCMKIGLAGIRAINIYDMWTAMGVLEKKCSELYEKASHINSGE